MDNFESKTPKRSSHSRGFTELWDLPPRAQPSFHGKYGRRIFSCSDRECNCEVVWSFFGIAFLWNWNETDLFQSCGHYWVFQICWRIECSTFTASSFRIWNSSTGIPSLPLVLFEVMLSKVRLTSHSKEKGTIWNTSKHSAHLNKDCPKRELANQSLICWGIIRT